MIGSSRRLRVFARTRPTDLRKGFCGLYGLVLNELELDPTSGDLYLFGDSFSSVGLWAGPSPLSGRVALSVDPSQGVAVCTSSGTVGPSLSMGRADAATVISPSGALADAAATELGNRIRHSEDMEKALDWVLSITGVTGAVVVMGETIGAKGEVELVPLKGTNSKD